VVGAERVAADCGRTDFGGLPEVGHRRR